MSCVTSNQRSISLKTRPKQTAYPPNPPLLATLTLFMCFACEKPPPRPLDQFEDMDLVVTDANMTGGEQAGSEADSGLGGNDVGDVDQGDAVTDALFDQELPTEVLPLPAIESRAFIETRDGIYIAWLSNEVIYRGFVRLGELGSEILTLDHHEWFRLNEDYGTSRVHLSMVGSNRPWLILTAEGHEAIALDLRDEYAEPLALGLSGEVMVAEGDDVSLILGERFLNDRSATSDSEDSQANEEEGAQEATIDGDRDKAVAWRFERAGEWGDLQLDEEGVTLPTSITKALGGWVLGSSNGQCHMLYDGLGISHSWRCHSNKESVLFGDEFSLINIGPLARSSDDAPRGSALWAWSATPGKSASPLLVDSISLEESSVSTTLTSSQILALQDGTFLRWLNRSGLSAALLDHGDEGLKVVTRIGVTSVPTNAPSLLFAAIGGHGLPQYSLIWDEMEGALKIHPQEANLSQEHSIPSARHSDERCVVSAEQCDEIDHDCDGSPRNQRCCPIGESVTSRLNEVLFPQLGWFTGDSELGALIAISSQGAARLFSFPTSGGEATLRAQWTEVSHLTHFSNYLSLVSILAEDEEGDALLLQNSQVNGSWHKRSIPCQPLGVTVLNAEHHTRVYCSEKSYRYESPELPPIEESYPESGELRWLTKWYVGDETLGQSYWIAAVGETAQVSVWKDELDQVEISDEAMLSLPNILGELSPSDRQIAFHVPPAGDGLLSRILDQQLIEAWVSGVGWTPIGGHRWPLWSTISTRHPMAITVGYSEDPQEVQDSFLQRINIRLHPLTTDGALFGELIREQISRDSFGGAHLAQYNDQEGDRPNLITLIAGSLELSFAECSP